MPFFLVRPPPPRSPRGLAIADSDSFATRQEAEQAVLRRYPEDQVEIVDANSSGAALRHVIAQMPPVRVTSPATRPNQRAE